MRLRRLKWIAVILALCLCAQASVAATRPTVSLTLHLNPSGVSNGAYVDNFPISGSVDVVALQPADTNSPVKTDGWELAIADDGKFYVALADVIFDAPLPAELEPGKSCHIPFRIVFSPEFARLISSRWDSGQISIATQKIFRVGTHSLKAVLRPEEARPVDGAVADPPVESTPVNLTIDPGYSVALSRGSILILLNRADGPIRRRIIDLYIPDGLLEQSDVLALIENADPTEKGRLSELYAARHFDLSRLHHFFPVTSTLGNDKLIQIDEAATRPFFISLSKAEKCVVHWIRPRGASPETFRVGKKVMQLTSSVSGEGEFHMPAEPGVYAATDDISGRIWGWILIQ